MVVFQEREMKREKERESCLKHKISKSSYSDSKSINRKFPRAKPTQHH